MYTFQNIFLSLKGKTVGVKWMAEQPAPGPKKTPQEVIAEATHPNQVLEVIKTIKPEAYTKMKPDQRDLLVAAHKKIQDLINTPTQPDKLPAVADGSIDKIKNLKEWYDNEKQTILSTSMQSRAGLTEDIKASDNNPRQAEALLKGLQGYKGNDGVAALIEAITLGEKKDDANNPSARYNKLDLGRTNLRGLVDFALSGLDKDKYRSNGSYFFGDSYAVNTFESIYKNHIDKLEPIFKEIQAFYNAGQTTEDWLLARSKITPAGATETYIKSDFISYLTTYREGTVYEFKKIDNKGTLQLESADRSFFTPYPPGELEGYFGNMKEGQLVTIVKDLIKKGGGETLATATSLELFIQLKNSPKLRANYIRGLNFVAMSPNRWEYFRTGNLEVGVTADKAKKLVEYLKDPKNLKDVRAGFEKSILENKKAVEDNKALTPDQKKNILTGIEKYTAEMNKDEVLRTVALDGMLTITNKGAAIGGGATWNIDTFLADTVSLGGALATDYKKGFGTALSLAFTKELYHSNKADFGVHYGLVAGGGAPNPFIGLHGSYEDALASVTKGPGFLNVFVGMRVGRNTDTIRDLEGLSSAQKEIFQLAGKARGKDISISGLVTDKAIAARMDTTIRSILNQNQYNKTDTQEENYAVLYPAVIEAMNQEVLLLRRESNDNGWVMKQIGINFGKIAGLTYALPGFRVGKDDLVTRVIQQEAKVQSIETLEKKEDVEKLLKSAGYTLTELFDMQKKQKQFVISGDISGKAAPVVEVEKDILGIETNKVTTKRVNNTITITAGRNIELKVNQGVDGKITIKVVDIGEFKPTTDTATNPTEATLAGIDLARSGDFEKLIQTKDVRVGLAYAFRHANADLSAFLKKYHTTDISNPDTFVEALLPDLRKLITLTANGMEKADKGRFPKAKASLDALVKALDTGNPLEKMSKIVRIRTGLMTDASNVDRMKLVDGNPEFQVKDGVNKNWESRKNSPALKALASTNRIDLANFDALMSTNAKTYKAATGEVNGVNVSKLIGVVAGYKGSENAHGFSVIPRGMMSIAVADDKPLIEEETSITNKLTALKILEKYQEAQYKKMIEGAKTAITRVTGLTADKVTDADIIKLMTNPDVKDSKMSITIKGKVINTDGSKFYRAAFGECLNTPTWAFSLGTISHLGKTTSIEDGSSISGSAVSDKTQLRGVLQTGVSSVEFGIAAGFANAISSDRPKASTQPQAEPGAPGNISSAPVVAPVGSTGPVGTVPPQAGSGTVSGGALAGAPSGSVAPAPTLNSTPAPTPPGATLPGTNNTIYSIASPLAAGVALQSTLDEPK